MIETLNLHVSDLFNDLDDKINHLIDDKMLGLDLLSIEKMMFVCFIIL